MKKVKQNSIKSPLLQIIVIKVIFVMNKEDKKSIKKIIMEISFTIIGAFIMAIGVSLFLLPNHLSSGGVSGIATIIYYLFNMQMGTTILIINIPLFIISMYKLGKYFLVKSIIGTIALSAFIDILDKINPLTNDKFLACIYGGIIIGVRNSNYFESELINRRK